MKLWNRITYTLAEFNLDDVRANRLGRLSERFAREQFRVSKTNDEAVIDWMIAAAPALARIDVTTLSNAERNRLTAALEAAAKLQINKANERRLRQAIEAATTIAEVRAVDITGGWAQ